jgi:hypothetical protein
MKMIPSERRKLERRAQELIAMGKMPTLTQVQAAIETTRQKFQPRMEYGPADFQERIHGLRVAAEKIYREEFEKIVCPPPVQLRFPFLEASR